MAKSREIPTADPLTESDPEESLSESEPLPLANADAPEEVSEESETEESDSEPESEPVKKAPAAAHSKPLAKADAPEEDSEESDYVSGSDPTSKPRVQPKKLSSPSAVAAKKPAVGMKRQATPALALDTNGKRSKVENSGKKGAVTENGKKLFERIFSPEDEIILLEELATKYPREASEMDDFYENIKTRVSASVSKAQVQGKIKKLRFKYLSKKDDLESTMKRGRRKRGSNNEEGKKKDGLESKAYELSDKIWGDEEMPKSTMSKGKGKLEEAIEVKSVSHTHDAVTSTEDWLFGEGKKLLDEETRGELEKEWKLLRQEEARILVKRFELSCKHAKLVYDNLMKN